MSAAKTYEFLVFGGMHPVCHCRPISCECSQAIGNPRVWWNASCLLMKLYFGVNASNAVGFSGFGKMHPVNKSGLVLVWMHPNHTFQGLDVMPSVY